MISFAAPASCRMGTTICHESGSCVWRTVEREQKERRYVASHRMQQGTCGGEVTVSSNTAAMTSPGYPDAYPVNRECHWQLRSPKGTHIKLQFLDLSIECTASFLDIYAGSTKDDPLLWRQCGNTENIERLVNSSNVLLVLFSGLSVEYADQRGFQLLHSSTDARGQQMKPVQSCGVPHLNNDGLTQPSDNVRIVGGKTADKGTHPWQVMFWEPYRRAYCGGALINERWIITAAHCFHPRFSKDLSLKEVVVRLGKTNQNIREPHEFTTKIIENMTHPRFDPVSFDNDIALVKMEEPVKFTEYITPICLGGSNIEERAFRRENQFGMASGWGRLSETGGTPQHLQEITLPIVKMSVCQSAIALKLTKNMFCAGYAQATLGDTCQGDSGGPLTYYQNSRWYLLGIVSWGIGCAREGKYGVYTKVNNYHKWINDNIGL